MEKELYIIRHCSAEGQSPHADLTAEGILQAEQVAGFFDDITIDRIISSPFVRAKMSASPLAQAKGLHVDEDSRLTERILSSHYFDDWLLKLEDSFLDMHLTYEGGESSHEAMERACSVIDELENGSTTVIMTHGNLMALMLKCFNEYIGFPEWQSLANPDIYHIQITGHETVMKRVWS